MVKFLVYKMKFNLLSCLFFATLIDFTIANHGLVHNCT